MMSKPQIRLQQVIHHTPSIELVEAYKIEHAIMYYAQKFDQILGSCSFVRVLFE